MWKKVQLRSNVSDYIFQEMMMKLLLPIFLLTGCAIGLQPIEPIEDLEEEEDNEPDSSPTFEPSVDTDTNDTDTNTPEPEDTNSDNLIPNLIMSISPTYGLTDGGTELVISGGPFTGDASVTIGGYPATLLSNTGAQIRVSTPQVSIDSSSEVRVDMDSGFGLSPENFNYFTDGTGQAGAIGLIEMSEYLGGYWQDASGNPITDGGKEGSFFLSFNYPADFHWWEFYAEEMDSCDMGSVDADGNGTPDSTNYYSYSGEVVLMDIESPTITLAGQSVHTLSRGTTNTEDINYFFYQTAGLSESDIIDNSFFTLDVPDGTIKGMNIPQFARASKQTVPSSPVMTGTNPEYVSQTQTFIWTPSGGDWVHIQMFHRNASGNIDSNIHCIAEDDGVFTISNFHQNWVSGEAMMIQFSRVYEADETLTHNNSNSGVIGVYTVIGAGFMN